MTYLVHLWCYFDALLLYLSARFVPRGPTLAVIIIIIIIHIIIIVVVIIAIIIIVLKVVSTLRIYAYFLGYGEGDGLAFVLSAISSALFLADVHCGSLCPIVSAACHPTLWSGTPLPYK